MKHASERKFSTILSRNIVWIRRSGVDSTTHMERRARAIAWLKNTVGMRSRTKYIYFDYKYYYHNCFGATHSLSNFLPTARLGSSTRQTRMRDGKVWLWFDVFFRRSDDVGSVSLRRLLCEWGFPFQVIHTLCTLCPLCPDRTARPGGSARRTWHARREGMSPTCLFCRSRVVERRRPWGVVSVFVEIGYKYNYWHDIGPFSILVFHTLCLWLISALRYLEFGRRLICVAEIS